MKPGDEVTLTLKGKVRSVSRHTGVCLEVELSQEHYGAHRTVWVDTAEVEQPSRALEFFDAGFSSQNRPSAPNTQPVSDQV